MKKIITVLLLCSCINVLAQYEKPKDVLRLMTYNVAYCRGYDNYQDGSKLNFHNTERIGKIIKELDPDIVALQELDSGNINRRFLLEEIQKASGIDYQVIYGRSDLADVGNYGVGILIKKKYPVLAIKKIKLPGTLYGSNPPIKNNDRLMLRITTDRFYFMCTHLDLNTEQRVNSAAIINSELDYMRKPSFLAGDLNDSHRWAGGIFPSFFNGTWGIYSTTDYTGSSPDSHSTIDYILYHNYQGKNEYSAVSSFAVRGPLGISNGTSSISVEYASDHLPVILDVKDNMVTGIEQTEGDNTSISRQNNELHINSLADNTNYSYQFYSTLGACVNSGSIEKDDSISLTNLNDGVYILRLTDNEKYVANWKFIK